MAKTYHQVTILITKDGKLSTDVEGVKGQACLDITKSLEEAMGGDVTSRKKKPEFFDKETNKESIKTGH